ncbi:(2R,3R)-2,3-butanediol dehydrogenase, partial [Halocaridina rubra]
MLWTTDKIMMIAFWGMVSGHFATVLAFIGIFSCFMTSFLVMWLISSGAWLYFASLQIPPSKKAVLITGCDSGFGNAIALHLDNLGFRVFAGCLFADSNGEGAEKLRKEGSDLLHVLQLDITKQEQLNKAVVDIKGKLSENEGLWGLVNNAGVCTMGIVEWTPLEMFRKDCEVNYFGMVSSTKSFLPLIRLAKGRIVNVTSMAGRITVPMMGGYCGSKYAAEAVSDALRLEMKPWGVHVAVIEPGNYAS